MSFFSFFKNKNCKQEKQSIEIKNEVGTSDNKAEISKELSFSNYYSNNRKGIETNDSVEKVISLNERIERLKPFNQIDLSPPLSGDSIVYIPVEGTFNTRFLTRMYLLRKHTVENVIVSGFDYIQYQIPVKSTNEELILLIYGTHFFEDIQSTEFLVHEIGNSKCSDVRTQLIEKCPIFNIISSLNRSSFYGRSGATNPYQIGINKILKWIEINNRKALEEYQLSESIETTIWLSEYKLFNYIKLWYPDTVFQFRAAWLRGQSIDVFIPSLDVAIEYQGKQHYEPVDYFGGEERFGENTFRDKIKRELCDENSVLLYYWPYDKKIKFSTVSSFLNKSEKDIITHLKQFKPFPVMSIIAHTTFCAQNKNQSQGAKKPTVVYRKYTKEGQFVKEYRTVKEAAEDSGISSTSIWKCLSRQHKTAGNHIWNIESFDIEPVFSNSPLIEKNEPRRENTGKKKKVIQIDPQTGEIIKIHISIAAAARSVDINTKGITDVIQGKQKTAGGYYWQDYYTE